MRTFIIIIKLQNAGYNEPVTSVVIYIGNMSDNKHSESIAKAIHVSYRPQQILKRHNCYKTEKGPKSRT